MGVRVLEYYASVFSDTVLKRRQYFFCVACCIVMWTNTIGPSDLPVSRRNSVWNELISYVINPVVDSGYTFDRIPILRWILDFSYTTSIIHPNLTIAIERAKICRTINILMLLSLFFHLLQDFSVDFRCYFTTVFWHPCCCCPAVTGVHTLHSLLVFLAFLLFQHPRWC